MDWNSLVLAWLSLWAASLSLMAVASLKSLATRVMVKLDAIFIPVLASWLDQFNKTARDIYTTAPRRAAIGTRAISISISVNPPLILFTYPLVLKVVS